ncbi:hypothetical protein AAW30_01870 [Arcobacter porcinus]|uniref:hypothetical protein n=1 Tax=Arcobacter porcinus TaxID=1935204 RepID=UPI0008265BAF|nr:hypothetical protein [Arcobacter porcinus]OCL81571.1 hypothetical protein AAW30_01870 [Arcobacter porcinus]
MNSYNKLKYVIRKLLNNQTIEVDSEEFNDKDITKNIYKNIITKLNHSKIICSIAKGINVIKSDLINKNYFFDNEKNVSILSPIVHIENNNIKYSIINYIFKSVPKKILFMFNNSFSNTFNEKLSILLEDNQKFSFFSYLIDQNKIEASKTLCSIKSYSSTKNNLIILPLEYFIYEDDWYICFYNLNLNDLDIIASKEIFSAQIIDKNFTNYISNKIISFVENRYKENEFLIKINLATLNQLVELFNINQYSIYTDKNINFYDKDDNSPIICKDMKITVPKIKPIILVKPLKKRLYKIKLNQKEEMTSCICFSNEVNYVFDKEKKYYIKLKITYKKMQYLKLIFNDLEILNFDNYRI